MPNYYKSDAGFVTNVTGTINATTVTAADISASDDLIVGDDAAITGTLTAADGSITGLWAVGSLTSATVAATGAVTGASVAVTGAATSATVAATGASTAASYTATGAVAGATLAASGAATVGGALTVTGILTTNGDFTQEGRLLAGSGTAAQFGAVATDVATGVSKPICRISASEACTWNSLSPASAQRSLFVNVGTFNITLVHASGTGTAALTFLCPNSANYVLTPNSSVEVWYDPTSSRNRVVGPVA